jgi:hypothetical protein
VTENEQEAAAIVALSDTIAEMWGRFAAALDAAGARGRAEVAAKVRELADAWEQIASRSAFVAREHDIHWSFAQRLRALADEADREARPAPSPHLTDRRTEP